MLEGRVAASPPSPIPKASLRAAPKNGRPLRAQSRAQVPARPAVASARSQPLRRCEARGVKFQKAGRQSRDLQSRFFLSLPGESRAHAQATPVLRPLPLNRAGGEKPALAMFPRRS